MAGSYDHVVDRQGRLLGPLELDAMLDTGGDVYEAIERLFGMVWLLADGDQAKIEDANMRYYEGLAMSPGTGGVLEGDDD